VNISSRGTHQVSGFDKREVKDCRNNSTSSQFVTDHENRQKDSFASKHKHHSSTDVSNDRFQVASSKQLVPHGGKHAPRGSSARSHGNTRDSNCYIVQEHPSNRALKRKQKKSRWINSIPRDAHHQYTSNKTRSFVKTAVHGQPLIVTSAKHQKKTQPSSAIHNGTLDQDQCCFILYSNFYKTCKCFTSLSCKMSKRAHHILNKSFHSAYWI